MKLSDKLTFGAAVILGAGLLCGLNNCNKRDQRHYSEVKRDFNSYFGADTNMAFRIIGDRPGKTITHHQMQTANELVRKSAEIFSQTDMSQVYAILGKPTGSNLNNYELCIAAERLNRSRNTNNSPSKAYSTK